MMEQEIDINIILKNLREIIGSQAQEIAVLKATIETINQQP
jgi:hypothetical protein